MRSRLLSLVEINPGSKLLVTISAIYWLSTIVMEHFINLQVGLLSRLVDVYWHFISFACLQLICCLLNQNNNMSALQARDFNIPRRACLRSFCPTKYDKILPFLRNFRENGEKRDKSHNDHFWGVFLVGIFKCIFLLSFLCNFFRIF